METTNVTGSSDSGNPPEGFDGLHPVLQHHIVSSLGWPALRPLQEESVAPLVAGEDAILLAPTAGGKTEAAIFPVLTRMAIEGWHEVSVLYICPLRALLNNLEDRLATYAGWLGRTVAVWHGDVSSSARKKLQRESPDILLTTPESLESMMVSTGVRDREFLGKLRVVIVDEVHSFAGDDRGWHLSAVLARLEHTVGTPLQRIGMSATVGNPEELLGWIQGGAPDGSTSLRSGRVIAPDVAGANAQPSAPPEIRVDRLENTEQVAALLSKLYQGEKRLVFVDSRKRVEELGSLLHEMDVKVYLSHSSLSAAERRRSEEAFAAETDCVIVSTSTLELGIDIGDLDRVIQVGSPKTVSSFLQRLGRTGRRPGTARNCLFIALPDWQGTDTALLNMLGMLSAWSRGFVEPVTPPPLPLHLVAQQFLAESLHSGSIDLTDWRQIWTGTPLMQTSTLEMDAQEVLDHLLEEGMLDTDGPHAFIGPAAEKSFGFRHFMDLLSAFTTAPLFTVQHGRSEIGTVEDKLLMSLPDDKRPPILSLAGRHWKVIDVDWKRHKVYVEPSDIRGIAKWGTPGTSFGYEISQGMRRVIGGESPTGVQLTSRAKEALGALRSEYAHTVGRSATVFIPGTSGQEDDSEWWNWYGAARNHAVIAALSSTDLGPSLAPPDQAVRYDKVRYFTNVSPEQIHQRMRDYYNLPISERPQPFVSDKAVYGLKFTGALPIDIARTIISNRLTNE